MVQPDNLPAQAQPQPAAVGLGPATAKEALKNKWQIRLRDPWSGVGNAHERAITAALQRSPQWFRMAE